MTAFFQFNHGFTTGATLPALLLSSSEELFRLRIFGTVSVTVLLIALGAGFGFTFPTDAVLATVICMYLIRPNPCGAARDGAVEPVFSRVLFVSCVP